VGGEWDAAPAARPRKANPPSRDATAPTDTRRHPRPPAIPPVARRSESIGSVESVKAASDVYAPVSGTVTDVNKVSPAGRGRRRDLGRR
jgi:hypothetical protein